MPPISIHALLAESDSKDPCIHTSCWNFYPRSPCGERPYLNCFVQKHTEKISIHALLAESDRHWQTGQSRTRHFYPRSPCGERPVHHRRRVLRYDISIHALLAESDAPKLRLRVPFLISIHALLAESDSTQKGSTPTAKTFLSTLSLRRATPPKKEKK